MGQEEGGAGEALLHLLEVELSAENDRMTSFHSRASSTLTTAGGLTTVVFGLTALSRDAGIRLGTTTRLLVFVSILCFAISASCGLRVMWVRTTLSVRPEKLASKIAHRNKPTTYILRSLLNLRVDQLRQIRGSNNDRALWFRRAITVQAAGIAALAAAAGTAIAPSVTRIAIRGDVALFVVLFVLIYALLHYSVVARTSVSAQDNG